MGTFTHTVNIASIAARMTASMGAAAVLAAAVAMQGPGSRVSPGVELLADSTALILGGTTIPTPDATYIDVVRDQYIVPTHPGQDIDYVAVTAPMELWPVTGVFRLLGLALGDPRMFGPGGPAWPDEPWWKLSGFFDLTAAQTVEAGAADLEAAIAEHRNGPLVIYGLSQGAGVANVVKKRLAEQYPAGTEAPAIDFVLSGDPNLPNGGLMSRFSGLYIPILDFPFNGPAATDTQFATVESNRQYDGFSDFPLYPLNLLADLNAVMGILYLHTNFFDVSLPADPTTSPAFQGNHGDTSYYFFKTQDLPLFAPLRALGVSEKLIDVVEPVVRALVELGYDRSIPAWEPTTARLFAPRDPETVTTNLRDAVHQSIDNARALVGAPPLPGATARNRIAASAPADADRAISTGPSARPEPLAESDPTRVGRSAPRGRTANPPDDAPATTGREPTTRSAGPKGTRTARSSASTPRAAASTTATRRHLPRAAG